MAIPARKMHLIAYLKNGPAADYPRAWRHPAASLHALWDADLYQHAALPRHAGRPLRETIAPFG
jgi:hypothetical protein